jgi:hypothetical protein
MEGLIIFIVISGNERRSRWSKWLLFLPGAITFGLGTWQILRRQDKVIYIFISLAQMPSFLFLTAHYHAYFLS